MVIKITLLWRITIGQMNLSKTPRSLRIQEHFEKFKSPDKQVVPTQAD